PAVVVVAYFGRLRKIMSNAKRAELADTGRGAVGKAAVVGVKDRGTNRVAVRHVAKTDAPHLAGFAAEKVKFGATIYSDEATVYQVLDAWYQHEAVNHSAGEYVRGMAHTNGMESFWSMLKRAHKGIYHKFSMKHLHRYIVEFAGRHNIRNAGTLAQMASLAAGMAGKRLTYAALIADNGLPSGARC
ncbi:MAG: IS1595 family transposase, partial [Alphaproteobacteria bacterium]|nr:IS1595 family transposase [Alphaproteobacteria bacterium]